MITLDVNRDYDKFRYVCVFKDTNKKLEWSMFLSDDVYDDPRRLSAWLRSLVQDIQVKNK